MPAQHTRMDGKRKAILEAAEAAFLANGYVGASMDEIAGRAGVSKQTVYKHFEDKHTLFRVLVAATIQAVSDVVHADTSELVHSINLEADLREFALRQLRNVMQPRVLRLRRLIIGEAGRFPQLGQDYIRLGSGRTVDVLAAAFSALIDTGAFRPDDPATMAQHFNWLVMSHPLNRAMLLGQDQTPGEDELEGFADAGVRAFLSAYARGR